MNSRRVLAAAVVAGSAAPLLATGPVSAQVVASGTFDTGTIGANGSGKCQLRLVINQADSVIWANSFKENCRSDISHQVILKSPTGAFFWGLGGPTTGYNSLTDQVPRVTGANKRWTASTYSGNAFSPNTFSITYDDNYGVAPPPPPPPPPAK